MLPAAKPLRVMLVDDDGIFRNFVRQGLEELPGVVVLEAGNGHEACRLLQAGGDDFALIVCDVYMPDMDGIELLDFLANRNYQGKLTMVSGGDLTVLQIARTFAVQSGLQLVGAFPKESVTPALLGAILDFG
jgi:CheY-like chemotaxis protein